MGNHAPRRGGILVLTAVAAMLLTAGREDLLRVVDEATRDVESLRGWTFRSRVETGIYSEAELRGFIETRFAEDYSDEELTQNEAFLRMIGSIADSVSLKETFTEVLLSQVGGFYDPAKNTFYMIAREGTQYPPIVDRMLVVHELTHALDDQYVSLDSLLASRDRTQDGEFVIGALVEGSATEVMTRFLTRAQISGDLRPADMQGLMESEMERSRVFFEAPRYFQTLLANYTCGMNFLVEGNMAALLGAAGDIDAGKNFLRAVADRPRTSEQILHPGKYWDPETRDEPILVDDALIELILSRVGYARTHFNTAGEILIAALTTPADEPLNPMAAGLPTYWTNPPATGWGGDAFYLVAKGAVHAGVWITLWDTPADRDEFADAYRAIAAERGGLEVSLGERGVCYLYGFPSEDAASIRAALTPDRLRFTQGSRSWSPAANSTR